jgi:hypothetical protein
MPVDVAALTTDLKEARAQLTWSSQPLQVGVPPCRPAELPHMGRVGYLSE